MVKKPKLHPMAIHVEDKSKVKLIAVMISGLTKLTLEINWVAVLNPFRLFQME